MTADKLLAEEAEIWKEYLKTTRNELGEKYEKIEPWAWRRLISRLGNLRATLD